MKGKEGEKKEGKKRWRESKYEEGKKEASGRVSFILDPAFHLRVPGFSTVPAFLVAR